MLEISLVGPPSAGKSTFFKSATMKDVEIADYPFTTIEPNEGMAFVRTPCPHTEIQRKCSPRNSLCRSGWRFTPFRLWDVAGLVEDAHLGKGRGIDFLNDISRAKGMIFVVDISGSTTGDGLPGKSDPLKVVRMLERELDYWFMSVLEREKRKIKGEMQRSDIEEAIQRRFSGMGVTLDDVKAALEQVNLGNPDQWREQDMVDFSRALRILSKPFLVFGNKIDKGGEENAERLREYGYDVVVGSAYYELALRMADSRGIIRYIPGDREFDIVGNPSKSELAALKKIEEFLDDRGTGVQDAINRIAIEKLGYRVVYPVEDEARWSDRDGNVLPDSFLVPGGRTVKDLAYMIHQEIGEKFVAGIDARTKRRVPADREIRMNDIITIKSRT